MKRKRVFFFWASVCLALFCFFLPAPNMAMGATTFRVANQVTVGWDPVTKLADGTAIPAGSTIQYQVYTRTDPAGTPVSSGIPIAATQAIVTFTTEGQYDIGIKVQRLVAGAVVAESAIAWSNDPVYAQGGQAWGDTYYINPGMTGNLH